MKKIGMARKVGLSAMGTFAAAIILAACQSGPPKISIEGVKAELSPAIIGEAMVTMNVGNEGGADVLRGVKTDIPGAQVTFHIMQGERMVHVDSVEVPAKSNLEFKMGGSHIMIEDMPKTMKKGSHFNLTLVFQKSGEKTMPLVLEGPAVMPMNMEHM